MGAVDGLVRFGPFELEVKTGELRKHGIRLKLQEQPLRIMLMLIEHPGALVTREEICRSLWPDGTSVDFDRSINVAVTRLRQVLGDSAESPKFVETVSRRGYRFVASDLEIQPTLVNPMPVVEGAPGTKAKSSGRLWAGLFLALLITIAGGSWFIRRKGGELNGEMRIIPLTSYPGSEADPSFSPDGDHVAFVWNGEQQESFNIYVKPIGPGRLQRLTSHSGNDHWPAWAPDGRSIAFLREIPTPGTATNSDRKLAVILIPALGGPERKFGEIPAYEGSILNWSPDGKWLVLSDRASEKEGAGIFLLSPDTGEKRRLTDCPPSLLGDYCPALSRDGRALVFVRWIGPDSGDLYTMPLSKELVPQGPPERLASNFAWVSKPMWTSNGREILFSYAAGDSGLAFGRLPAVKPVGHDAKPQRIAALGAEVFSASISYVRNRLVYKTRSKLSENIWRMDLSSVEGNGARVTPRSRQPSVTHVDLIASTRHDSAPAYSPDGKRIAFISDRSGRDEIWLADCDGKNPFQLTDFVGERTGTPHWSPDSRYIAFDARVAGTQGDLFVMDIEEKKPKHLTHDPGEELEPTWSRDGRWIYFGSRRTSDWQVWKISSQGGGAIQVTKNGGFYSLESPDRKYLYYAKSFKPARGIWRIPIEGGEETEVVSSLSGWRNFAVTEQGIYFTSSRPRSIEFLSFSSGRIKTVLANEELGVGLDLSPDGRYLLYTTGKRIGSDLMLVENFR